MPDGAYYEINYIGIGSSGEDRMIQILRTNSYDEYIALLEFLRAAIPDPIHRAAFYIATNHHGNPHNRLETRGLDAQNPLAF